jgi:hypothetical protein
MTSKGENAGFLRDRVSVRAQLPEDLRPVFDQLVSDYQAHATAAYGRPLVSYHILAELVRAGWRGPTSPTTRS